MISRAIGEILSIPSLALIAIIVCLILQFTYDSEGFRIDFFGSSLPGWSIRNKTRCYPNGSKRVFRHFNVTPQQCYDQYCNGCTYIEHSKSNENSCNVFYDHECPSQNIVSVTGDVDLYTKDSTPEPTTQSPTTAPITKELRDYNKVSKPYHVCVNPQITRVQAVGGGSSSCFSKLESTPEGSKFNYFQYQSASDSCTGSYCVQLKEDHSETDFLGGKLTNKDSYTRGNWNGNNYVGPLQSIPTPAPTMPVTTMPVTTSAGTLTPTVPTTLAPVQSLEGCIRGCLN